MVFGRVQEFGRGCQKQMSKPFSVCELREILNLDSSAKRSYVPGSASFLGQKARYLVVTHNLQYQGEDFRDACRC